MYTRWVIEDTVTGRPVALRGAMDEATCRRYVGRGGVDGRYRLLRVDVTEVVEEVPVEPVDDGQ